MLSIDQMFGSYVLIPQGAASLDIIPPIDIMLLDIILVDIIPTRTYVSHWCSRLHNVPENGGFVAPC